MAISTNNGNGNGASTGSPVSPVAAGRYSRDRFSVVSLGTPDDSVQSDGAVYAVVQRLKWTAGIIAAFSLVRLGIAALTIATGGSHPRGGYMLMGSMVIGALVAFLLWLAIQREWFVPQVGLQLGVGWGFFTSVSVSISSNAANWNAELMPGWSLNSVWILLFAILVPRGFVNNLMTALAMAVIEPICILGLVQAGVIAMPTTGALIQRVASGFIAAPLASFMARFIYRLETNSDLARDIGSYRLLRVLGQGAMGEVWLATHRFLKRPAAMKFVRPAIASPGTGSSSNASIDARFEREARTTASLRSPHTVDVFEYGLAPDGTYYYVMELLEGIDLAKLVKTYGPVPPARAVHMVKQICHSLHEAHERGLIHRDIKPSNVVACQYGLDFDFIKVLDFGLVSLRRYQEDHSMVMDLTQDHFAIGTPGYMAPEVALDKEDVDRRADIYAVGCLLYWLIAGRRVFEGESPTVLLSRHLASEPQPLSKATTVAIPAELDRLVLECLAKEPVARPATAHEVYHRLKAIVFDPPWTNAEAETWWRKHQPAPPWREELDSALAAEVSSGKRAAA